MPARRMSALRGKPEVGFQGGHVAFGPTGDINALHQLVAKTVVVVCITGYGPYRRGRIIDMSRAAARELDMIDSGTMVNAVRQ